MENLKLDDFTKYKFLSDLEYSPDGKFLAFILHRMDLEENKYLSNIWLYDIEKKQYSQLTTFDEEKSFIWLDDSSLLFPSIRNEKDKKKKESSEPFTQYYKINIHGGEAKKSLQLPMYVTDMKKINDDTLLISAIYDNNLLESSKDMKEEKDYEVLDEIPFWLNGQGFTNKKRNRLYIYNIKENKLKSITNKFTDVSSFSLNKDRNLVVLITNTFTDKMETSSDLCLYDIKKDELKKLTHEKPFSYCYADFLDEYIIFVGTDMQSYGINENNHFFRMDLHSKKVTQISSNKFDYSIWNTVGSDCRYGNNKTFRIDEKYLYFITTEYDSSYINRIDISGNMEKVTNENGSIDSFDIHKGSIAFIGLKNMKLQELYALKNKKEVQITQFNEWVMNKKKTFKPEKIKIETYDDIIIEGWIMKPVDFDANKKYPAILDIHGGPKTVYGEVFFHEMQYWANEGYVVFFCNPRGSDGRGNEFADIRGKYGIVDFEDLMDFTDAVISRCPFIDKKKLGVTGGSYGGFMTNWIIGHTDRFKAAASQRSISNWISKFTTTDIGYYFVDDQQASTPWNDIEKLWFHSPLKYANKVTTPTLFIHSEEDFRCWLPEGIQMFTALKYHGVDARLCMFRGENHGLSRNGKPKHRIRRLQEMTDWFNKYLK